MDELKLNLEEAHATLYNRMHYINIIRGNHLTDTGILRATASAEDYKRGKASLIQAREPKLNCREYTEEVKNTDVVTGRLKGFWKTLTPSPKTMETSSRGT